MKKVGLLGGSFDPPHYGHLIMGQEAINQCQLDEVWFMPTYLPPHKHEKTTAGSAEARLEMIKRAVMGNQQFDVSTIEYERKGKSYTYDTVRRLLESYENIDFYFLLGADMINDLPNWYKFKELSRLITFIGFHRPQYKFSKPDGIHIVEAEMPIIDISSTAIRERIQKNKIYRYFLPDNVRKYIEEKDVYG